MLNLPSLRGETQPLTHFLSKELLSGQLLLPAPSLRPQSLPHSIQPVPPSQPHFSLSPSCPPHYCPCFKLMLTIP